MIGRAFRRMAISAMAALVIGCLVGLTLYFEAAQ